MEKEKTTISDSSIRRTFALALGILVTTNPLQAVNFNIPDRVMPNDWDYLPLYGHTKRDSGFTSNDYNKIKNYYQIFTVTKGHWADSKTKTYSFQSGEESCDRKTERIINNTEQSTRLVAERIVADDPNAIPLYYWNMIRPFPLQHTNVYEHTNADPTLPGETPNADQDLYIKVDPNYGDTTDDGIDNPEIPERTCHPEGGRFRLENATVRNWWADQAIAQFDLVDGVRGCFVDMVKQVARIDETMGGANLMDDVETALHRVKSNYPQALIVANAWRVANNKIFAGPEFLDSCDAIFIESFFNASITSNEGKKLIESLSARGEFRTTGNQSRNYQKMLIVHSENNSKWTKRFVMAAFMCVANNYSSFHWGGFSEDSTSGREPTLKRHKLPRPDAPYEDIRIGNPIDGTAVKINDNKGHFKREFDNLKVEIKTSNRKYKFTWYLPNGSTHVIASNNF